MLVAGVVTRLKWVGMQHKGSVGKLMCVQEKSFVQDKENHCPQNKDCKSFFRNISTEYQNHVAKVTLIQIQGIPNSGDISKEFEPDGYVSIACVTRAIIQVVCE